MDQPVWTWEPWKQEFHSNGYLAAMNGETFDPFQTDEWKMGFALYLETHVSAPIRTVFSKTSSTHPNF